MDSAALTGRLSVIRFVFPLLWNTGTPPIASDGPAERMLYLEEAADLQAVQQKQQQQETEGGGGGGTAVPQAAPPAVDAPPAGA